MDLMLDANTLTIGDIEDIEDITGLQYDRIDWNKPSGKVIKALVYIAARKDNPDFTLEDARNVAISEIKTADPTQAGDAS